MARAGLTGPRIRIAHVDDLPTLLDLLEQLGERATPGVTWERASEGKAAAKFAEILSDERRVFLVAEADGGEVVGTADLVVVPNLTHAARPIAYVENVVVDREHRNRGIGAALMAECETRAREAGAHKLQLLSNADRTDAHRFYEGLGFEQSSRGYRRYL